MKMRIRVASPTVLAAERQRKAGQHALGLLQGLVSCAYIQEGKDGQHRVYTSFINLEQYGRCCACLAKAREAENDMGSARAKLVKA